MKKTDLIKTLGMKVADLNATINQLKVADMNKQTRGTQLYARKKELRTLNLLRSLIELCPEEVPLESDDVKIFTLLTTLAADRVRETVSCEEGDSILELLERYRNVKDLSSKLNKYCEKNDLVLNYQTGVVEAK